MGVARHTLHTCHFGDRGGSVGHPCGKAAKALREQRHDVEVRVAAVGHPFGLATRGRRPAIRALSGQEKLPVLELADGTVIAGSDAIVQWARGGDTRGGAAAP